MAGRTVECSGKRLALRQMNQLPAL